MYREILTKAIIAKGEKTIKQQYTIELEHEVSKVLGCYIINHSYKISHSKSTIMIQGDFDAFFWYGFDSNTNCGLQKKNYSYSSEIPYSFTIESYPLDEKSEIHDKIITQPSCTSMKFVGKSIIIDVETTISLDIVGETKLKIKVDDVIVDQVINTDYVKDKH